MTRTLSIAKAKAHFAEFIRRAEGGETVILTRHGRPVARLGPSPRGTAAANDPADAIREPAGSYNADRPNPPGAAPLPAAPADLESRREALERLLEQSIWPRVPDDQLGVHLDKRERENILGYRSEGV